MQRQLIDNGRWFDLAKARKFEEDTFWDGRNHCSRATGSPWVHEALYCTRTGVYVVNRWSGEQGSRETWTQVDAATAADWLTRNGYEAPDAETARAQAEAEV